MRSIDFVNQISDKIRMYIFYLGLQLIPPISILALICSIVGLVFSLYFMGPIFSVPLAVFAVVSILFFTYALHYALLPAKRVKIIADAYGDNPRIIPFVAKKVEGWLEDIINFMEKQPNMEDVEQAIMIPLNPNRLQTLQKLQKKIRSTKRLINGIERKGDYLNALITGVSESLQISRESIEELINSKVNVIQNISNEINISYEQIQAYIGHLIIGGNDTAYYKWRIEERIQYLRSKKGSLTTQIEWIKEFDKRKEATPELLKIIKGRSTGKAVSDLCRLLLDKGETEEDIIWLIRFADSRKGAKISELLGLKIRKINGGKETLNWYGTPISKDNLQTVKEFLESFVKKRSKALEELWEKFINWNEKNEKLDLNQPIGIGLTFGYSAALRKILQRLCKYVKNIERLRIILIKSTEAPGDEEILKAELMTECPELKEKNIIIMPIEVIEKKEITPRIGVIFAGIESISKQGDIVHPRGGSEIIRKIREYKEDTKVYAFGESYKVQGFTEDDIDYTKLSLFRHENIDYVVTDCGVHERERENWRRSIYEQEGEELRNDLNCCDQHWKETYIKEFLERLRENNGTNI